VISADSMQVYRGMDIGTAKPTRSDLARLPHHLLDVVDPSAQFSAGEFVRRADGLIADIRSRGRIPVVSGGTGFYLRSFLYGMPAAPKSDPVVRRQLLELAAEKSGWDRPMPPGHSRGIAVAESFGSYVAQVAEISIADGRLRVHRVICALDCGQVINPDTVRAQMQSGIVYGLTAALKGAITIAGGGVAEGNFDTYPLLGTDEMPIIDVHIVPSGADPGGVGEPGTPPIAPAVVNAVFAATGRPVRRLPIRLSGEDAG